MSRLSLLPLAFLAFLLAGCGGPPPEPAPIPPPPDDARKTVLEPCSQKIVDGMVQSHSIRLPSIGGDILQVPEEAVAVSLLHKPEACKALDSGSCSDESHWTPGTQEGKVGAAEVTAYLNRITALTPLKLADRPMVIVVADERAPGEAFLKTHQALQMGGTWLYGLASRGGGYLPYFREGDTHLKGRMPTPQEAKAAERDHNRGAEAVREYGSGVWLAYRIVEGTGGSVYFEKENTQLPNEDKVRPTEESLFSEIRDKAKGCVNPENLRVVVYPKLGTVGHLARVFEATRGCKASCVLKPGE